MFSDGRIAKLHAQLGNWSCAADALRVSEEKSELSRNDPRAVELEQLKRQLEDQLIFVDPG